MNDLERTLHHWWTLNERWVEIWGTQMDSEVLILLRRNSDETYSSFEQDLHALADQKYLERLHLCRCKVVQRDDVSHSLAPLDKKSVSANPHQSMQNVTFLRWRKQTLPAPRCWNESSLRHPALPIQNTLEMCFVRRLQYVHRICLHGSYYRFRRATRS